MALEAALDQHGPDPAFEELDPPGILLKQKKQHPGAVKISDTYVAERDFRWNVAVGLRNADLPLVDAVDRALDALMADQTIAKIMARYGITYRAPLPE